MTYQVIDGAESMMDWGGKWNSLFGMAGIWKLFIHYSDWATDWSTNILPSLTMYTEAFKWV